jgi:nitric oxide reductase NorE protein
MDNKDLFEDKTIDYKNIFYPPGGILIWIIILLELFTFTIGLIVFNYQSKGEESLFHDMSTKLNLPLGSLNTLILLTSGYCMATSLQHFKNGNSHSSITYLRWTMILGSSFIIIKTVEYAMKIQMGFTLGSNSFMTFYWLLTGFHLLHVLIGMVILIWMHRNISMSIRNVNLIDLEAGAAFWHLCDLIWLLIFPVLYFHFLK